MIVYMLKSEKGYYKRGQGRGSVIWVKQEDGSIWPNKQGPISAKGSISRRYGYGGKPPHMTIEAFKLVPITRL